jgi:hypothetical protein
MNYSIFDIEANGLLHKTKDAPEATKIYCLSAYTIVNGVGTSETFVSYDEMRAYIRYCEANGIALIGHNIYRYDIPMLEKHLDIKITTELVDTLALSWYLYPKRIEHGLEAWGEDLGIAKPHVADWQNDTIETYMHRCQEDVKINTALFNMQGELLLKLYEGNKDEVRRLVRYLMFKMDCAREQEVQKWRLDIEVCKANLNKLLTLREEKTEALKTLMPKVIKYTVYTRPSTCFKKDGSISVHGQNWFKKLAELGLPEDHLGAIKYPTSEEEPNPGSHQQMKAYLFSLGWEPLYIKEVKHKETGEIKMIPQISNEDGTDVCESVKELYEDRPELEALESYFILRHRIGILEGFLERVDEDGYLMAQIKGLTNTLRFKHTTIVNLPTIPKPYWEEVRGCLITDLGYELCGSDMSGLEDNTKQHYMYYFDPEYVREMRTPGFDPHIDIAVIAKLMSYDEGEFYKWYDKKKEGTEYYYTPPKQGVNPIVNYAITNKTFVQLISQSDEDQARLAKDLKPIRLKSKKVNFAGVYGAGGPKIAKTAKVSLNEGYTFHKSYWIRNKAVKLVADSCFVKNVGGQMWLYNPVSRFWYSLRIEKDKFSTLNQGTGVYCFDTWVSCVRAKGIKLVGQFHDEIIFRLPKYDNHPVNPDRILVRDKLNTAIEETNNKLNLNVPLKISIDFGDNYAQIH